MKHRLEELLDLGSKHWVLRAKKDEQYVDWVMQQTADMANDTPFVTRVFCATYGERPQCPHGNERKIVNITLGWKFCGKTAQCACAREQVSASVSRSKQAATEEQRAATQAAREATNLARYGHINTGQTEQAKAAHQAFYADQDNIRNQLRRQVDTMRRLYGVDNCAQDPEVAERKATTMLERHGLRNPMQSKSIAARSIATRLAQGYAEDYYRRNYDRLCERLTGDYGMQMLTPFEDYQGTAAKQKLSLSCVKCGRKREWRVDYGHHPRCFVCDPAEKRSASKAEIEMLEFIRTKLGVRNVVWGDRDLLAPLEIDILAEQHKVAIEYCGLYWHGEKLGRDRHYHLAKLVQLDAQGYRLLTIFSDEWLTKRDIVQSKLSLMFGRIEDRRFARKLRVVELSHRQAAEFYNAAHILGGVKAAYHLGLMDGATVIAAMSFADARNSKKLPEGSYELVRFASAPYVIVVGGASKLFQHFVRTQQPEAIVSYADRRWSDGGLYKTLGFVLTGTTPPDYSYIDDDRRRLFRFNFRREVLTSIIGEFDETEREIMRALDYDRVWDCGKYRFDWGRSDLIDRTFDVEIDAALR